MKIARSPKSVIWRQLPSSVESAQILVVKPSVSGIASHLPSGDKAGFTTCQVGRRDA